MNISDLHLCLLTDIPKTDFQAYKQWLAIVVQAGVTSVQLRAKDHQEETITDMAYEIKAMLDPLNVPLILNDHVDVAKKVGAAGVHLGQSDGDPTYARHVLGPDAWIGLSIETWDELSQVNTLTSINYIAASAVFPTSTKTNCRTYWGLEGLKMFVQRTHHPVIAIGGINLDCVADVMACGVAGVAVISAIHEAKHPVQVTHALLTTIRETVSC